VLFNSKIFVVFLALVVLVYYPLPQRAKVWFLLAMSWLFYGFWDPSLLGLIILSTFVDYWCGRSIAAAPAQDTRRRKAWLWLSLIVNLGMLGFFKYYDFFVGELIDLGGVLGLALDRDRYLLELLLPVGISFYTFQTMAYTIDVYRGDIQEPERDFARFALYVAFFPQLVAGPVERAPHLLPQFSRPFRLSIPMVKQGVFLILLGFIKKVVIADRLARAIEPWYEADILRKGITGAEAAAAQLLFTCQIYVDFSSYSDIAIGLGLLLGYTIRPNFDLPFVVPSIPERWRRWHISMSHWFRDYIFIPLGGSRKGEFRTQANIMAVMFLSGLWHGASNNFVVWGLLNGATMVIHKLVRPPFRSLEEAAKRNWWTGRLHFYSFSWLTFCLIAAINIFFRCPDWPTAMLYIDAIFLSGAESYAAVITDWKDFPDALARGGWWVLFVFVAHEAERYFQVMKRVLEAPTWRWAVACLAAFLVILVFGISGPQFIYYQF
jgi:alginate O-acetyltransferase complex protein AlgI